MKKSILLYTLAATALFASAAAPLRFNSDGKLKIVQFTDNHYKWGNKASNATVECMEAVLDAEQPDFVMFTGDLVYSDGVEKSIDVALQPVVDRGLPFAFVFGNHDVEFDRGYGEIYDQLASKPGSIMPPRGNVESPDYVLEVASSADSTRTAYAFYCLDSHQYSPIGGCGKYAWLEFDQIKWYRDMSDSLQTAYGKIPALMFFHIPLPEYDYAHSAKDAKKIGTKDEKVCSPKLNSGMFTAIKEQGDVRGVFCGHDHDNDYAVMYFNVLLAYGRYSGGKTVYNHLGTNGARVIEINEGNGNIDTWIRLSNGEQLYPFTNKVKK